MKKKDRMNIQKDRNLRQQPPKPKHYRLPPVVQPNWKLSDLTCGLFNDQKEKLASRLCERYGVRHCLLLDRARSGLYLLRKALDLSGEWISTSVMHRPTGVLLKNICDSVAFADIDESFTMSVDSVSALISPQTSTILATHMFGKSADIVKLRQVVDSHGLFLIENGVHMAGNMTIAGQRLGSFGDATILSFNVDKPLGAILGGALLTNRNDIWKAVSRMQLGAPNTRETYERILSTYLAYRLKSLILKLPGTGSLKNANDGVADIEAFSIKKYSKYNPLEIHRLQATLALCCSQREDAYINTRRCNAELLTRLLKSNSKLQLPYSTPTQPHAFTYYPIVFKDHSRYKIGQKMAKAGIETKWRYYPLHLQPGFTEIRRNDLSQSEALWASHLLFPAGVSTSVKQIEYLANSINSVLM